MPPFAKSLQNAGRPNLERRRGLAARQGKPRQAVHHEVDVGAGGSMIDDGAANDALAAEYRPRWRGDACFLQIENKLTA